MDAAAVVAARIEAKAQIEAEAVAQSEAEARTAAAVATANTVTAAAAKTKTTSNDDDDEEEEEDNSIMEVFGEPTLKPSTSFTIDEEISLKYQLLLDLDQPLGSRGRFAGEDLMQFISTTTSKYCLVISKPPYLQLLHSAFKWGDWVYASTSCSGVDDYWMKLLVQSLVMPMKDLGFESWLRDSP